LSYIISFIPVYVWPLIHAGLVIWCIYHVLLYKRESRAAMGWIMVSIFIPYFGPLAYYLFGINRVRSRARGLRRRFFNVRYESTFRTLTLDGEAKDGLRGAGEKITGCPLLSGNKVLPLYNGDQAFSAMLEAIAKGASRILLSTYILKIDVIGEAFASALEEAVSRGLEVKVLVDGVGEFYSWRRPSNYLRKRNVEVARFLPPKLFPPSIYINMRNHRKLLVVDDRVAFAGGMNIGDEYREVETNQRQISDIHFQLQGPVVPELATIFINDWHFATGLPRESLPEIQTDLKEDQGAACRIIPDGPDEELDALALTIQTVISAADSVIDIMTPYFLPDRGLLAALTSASLRGVSVRIVLPEKNNLFYMHWANQNLLIELLQCGVEVYYQPPPFCHSKLLRIDSEYTLIGSANLDPRSLRLNFELGIEVFDRDMNDEMARHFDKLITNSTAVSYDELANRSIAVRLRDSAAALFSPYL